MISMPAAFLSKPACAASSATFLALGDGSGGGTLGARSLPLLARAEPRPRSGAGIGPREGRPRTGAVVGFFLLWVFFVLKCGPDLRRERSTSRRLDFRAPSARKREAWWWKFRFRRRARARRRR